MATKKKPPTEYEKTERPLVVEEITVEQARTILRQKGFKRLIQITRDPRTGHIVDLILREMA